MNRPMKVLQDKKYIFFEDSQNIKININNFYTINTSKLIFIYNININSNYMHYIEYKIYSYHFKTSVLFDKNYY